MCSKTERQFMRKGIWTPDQTDIHAEHPVEDPLVPLEQLPHLLLRLFITFWSVTLGISAQEH